MTRSINSATQTALAGDNFNIATLIQLDFQTVIRLTDWQRDINAYMPTANPEITVLTTFTSSPDLKATSNITESGELRINETTIEFGGESQTYISLFFNNDYIDVRGLIWRAVLDSTDTVIGAPILIFDGRITTYGISDDDTSSKVAVSLASHWKDFGLVKNRMTNSNSQQLYFPSDRGLDYAHEARKDIKWGKS